MAINVGEQQNQQLLKQVFGDNIEKAKDILKGHGTDEPFITNTLLRLCWIMKPMAPVQPRDKSGRFKPLKPNTKEKN